MAKVLALRPCPSPSGNYPREAVVTERKTCQTRLTLSYQPMPPESCAGCNSHYRESRCEAGLRRSRANMIGRASRAPGPMIAEHSGESPEALGFRGFYWRLLPARDLEGSWFVSFSSPRRCPLRVVFVLRTVLDGTLRYLACSESLSLYRY